MNTFQEQKEFFDKHWPAMKSAVESGGGNAVAEFIGGFEDDLERRVLYIFARQGLVFEDWDGKNFDDYIAVCDAGVAEVLSQAEAAEDDETRAKRFNAAHILSYNLSADLAPCWPGDDAPRDARHFERGLKAARDCLTWCAPEVHQGLSMDWWAKGTFELFLDDAGSAVKSFEESLEFAKKVAEENGEVAALSPKGGFGVILGAGYLGIAQAVAGEKAGNTLYFDAVSAFGAQTADESKADDAKFGIAQLERVREQFAEKLAGE